MGFGRSLGRLLKGVVKTGIGAGAGFAMGGPVGAVAGGLGGLGDSIFGSSKPKVDNIPLLSPEQIQAQNQVRNLGLQQLQQSQGQLDLSKLPQIPQLNQGDIYQGFDPIADYARKGYQTSTVPTLAERYQGMTGSSRQGPENAQMAAAGADLEGQLAALRSQYGMENRGMGIRERGSVMDERSQLMNAALEQQRQAQGLIGMGLSPQFQPMVSERQPGFEQTALGGLSQYMMKQGVGNNLFSAFGGGGSEEGNDSFGGSGENLIEQLRRLSTQEEDQTPYGLKGQQARRMGVGGIPQSYAAKNPHAQQLSPQNYIPFDRARAMQNSLLRFGPNAI